MGFEWAYRNGEPPWDIGRPQPALVRLAEQGSIAGSVVDVGCGTGESALYLAGLGLDVTGVDLAPTAIARARTTGAARGVRATFEIADALDLASLGRQFDVAVDLGMFHTLSDGERLRFERSIRGALRPGGRYFLVCFSDEEPGEGGPRRVSQAEIHATFSSGWRVDSIVPERFATRDRAGGSYSPRAWLASLTRLSDGDGDRPASKTALGAAGLRAAHLIHDEAPPILDDHLALGLLDPEAALSVERSGERFRTVASRALRCEIVVRSRYAEDSLADAVRRGTRQYAILGAGLDTFAFRQPNWAASLHIIEIDHAASQVDKRSRLSRTGLDFPANLTVAPADLETSQLLPELMAAGLDLSRPAFVACLGVLIYLSENAAEAIFRTVGGLAPGSEFVFTFSQPVPSSAGVAAPGSAAERMAAIGEPWRTRFEPATVERRLREAGAKSIRFLVAADVRERYLGGRGDGLIPPPRSVIGHATI